MKTSAQRQFKLRQRRAKDGLRQRVFWLTDEQAEKVKRYVDRLLKRGSQS